MIFDRIACYVSKAALPVAKVLNIVAGAVLAFMMFFTGIDVVARYFFHAPILGSFEIMTFMLPAVVAFAFAYCFVQEGHVRVDLLTSLLSEKKRAVLHAVSYFSVLVLFVILTIATFQRFMFLYNTGKTSEVLYWPYYPFVLIVFIGWLAVVLVALQKLCEAITKAVHQ